MVSEEIEGGQQEALTDVIFASRVQFYAALFALLTGLSIIISAGLHLVLHPKVLPAYKINSYFPVYFNNTLEMIGIINSICNDICTHVLAVFVVDEALVTAHRIHEERVARAADKLLIMWWWGDGHNPWPH